jgi:ATP-binding cassette, subfamily C, bacterial CydC
MTVRPAVGGLLREGRSPLVRLLGMARPLRARLLVAVAAGAAATGCGVALLAVSGFLLARASQHPSIIAISAAVVAVRALSIGRGVSRYLERLAAHDVAFGVLAQVRVAIWRRLEALAPAGVALFRSGDLLARLISDVDATQDLFIRGGTPVLAAVLVGGGAVTACLLILAPAAAVLAAGLLTAGIVVPLAGAAVARRAARAAAPARAGSPPPSPTSWTGRPTCTPSARPTPRWPTRMPWTLSSPGPTPGPRRHRPWGPRC